MSELDQVTFMVGLHNSEFDQNKCDICGGTGFKEIRCCGGLIDMCGCMGMPVDYEDCPKGCQKLSDDQIALLSKQPTTTGE